MPWTWQDQNPIAMADADKEDAVMVAVTRDGKAVPESRHAARCQPDELAPKVKDLLDQQAD